MATTVLSLSGSAVASQEKNSASPAMVGLEAEGDFSALNQCLLRTYQPYKNGSNVEGVVQSNNYCKYHKLSGYLQRHRWHGWSTMDSVKDKSDYLHVRFVKSCKDSGNQNYRTHGTVRRGTQSGSGSSPSNRFTC
ncbi:hypothetical protein QNO07_10530 [Streptomyces sp. 549]|uniref:hypothetical protein n=1 Tax=Streptomyces sp. 549 TaxID=3049076 RepID=UPI0024C3E481|nr:hypothetical protein [Streptomyces sp. 549]MDK1473851.1 hypothetical protein [Streptomyces sp. 549]